MKHFALSLILIAFCSASWAQKAYLADPDNFDPEAETKLMIDIKQCECQKLLDNPGPLYIWTWKPFELDGSDPNANGQWTASNAALELTNEGDNVWSFTLIPTEFYKVDAATVYAEDFHFLVKGFDGGGGGTCEDENKTEDLSITVDPPFVPVTAIQGFPAVFQGDDVFTVIYNNNIEEKETMQNLEENNAYVYMLATTTDSVDYQIETFFNTGKNPDLQMSYRGEGIFYKSFIPNDFFAIPETETIQSMTFVVRKENYGSSDDRSGADHVVAVGCPE